MEAANSPQQRRLRTFCALFFMFLLSVSLTSMGGGQRESGSARSRGSPNAGEVNDTKKKVFEDLEIEFDAANESLVIHFFTPNDKLPNKLRTRSEEVQQVKRDTKWVSNSGSNNRIKIEPLKRSPGSILGQGSTNYEGSSDGDVKQQYQTSSQQSSNHAQTQKEFVYDSSTSGSSSGTTKTKTTDGDGRTRRGVTLAEGQLKDR